MKDLVRKFYLTLWLLGLFLPFGMSQRVLLSKAKVHVGNGKVINQGLVGIEGDKIVLVENALTYKLNPSKWDTIIDLKGKELYPGFIAPNSILGLTDINAVRASRDYNEVGEYNPNVRSVVAFNADSELNATAKLNGVLYAQVAPRGGVISGSSSVVKLEAWDWKSGVEKADDGIHLYWPSAVSGGGWWADPKNKKVNKKYSEEIEQIYHFFELAKAYSTTKGVPDLRFEAMRTLFDGTARLYIHADRLRELTDIVDFKSELKLPQVVIVGGYESYKVVRPLKDAEIPVILRGMHDLPMNEDDPVDLTYRIPAMLQNAGILFCIENTGSMEYINERNLPFLAGTAMAYGLTEEEAVAAISFNAAQIMGVSSTIGSLEVGKQATLFVSEGNALEIETNQLMFGMIDGEFIQSKNHQTRLYEKYQKRYK